MDRRTAFFVGITFGTGLLAAGTLGGCVPATGGGGGGGFNLPPTPVITVDVERGVAPLTVQFNSDRSSDDGLIIAREWNFGDGTTSQEISPRHTYNSTGEFQVSLTLTDDLGAQATRTTTIFVTEAPVAIISADRTAAPSAPAVVQFDGTASFDPDGTIEQYEWDFGDGSSELLPTVLHQFASSGTFRVTLTVTDDTGITDSTEILIEIGIRQSTIELRVPPDDVNNIVVSQNSPLWIQGVFDSEPGVARFIRAGLDGDRDQCQSQSVIFDLETGITIDTVPDKDVKDPAARHEAPITGVDYSADGTTFVTASEDATVRLYNAAGDLIDVYDLEAPASTIEFAPEGTQFAVGLTSGDIVLIDSATSERVRMFNSHTTEVNDLNYSVDGELLISAGSDRRAILWSVDNGTILRDFRVSLGANAAVISPIDNSAIAVAGEDAVITLFNATSGRAVGALEGHTAAINALVFSSDGRTLFSASDDNTVRSWDALDGFSLNTFTGHTDAALALDISHDDARLISGAADGSAIVWDTETAELLRTVMPCTSDVAALSASSDERSILLGIASRNDIQLDTASPSGNDLNITTPQALMLSEVAALSGQPVVAGRYFLWAEIDTDRTEPVRTYAGPEINVAPTFPSTIGGGPPQVALSDDEATVVVDPTQSRQIFDIGPLNQGDRLFVSIATTPGFGQAYDVSSPYSAMIVDENLDIVLWYQRPGFILFTPDAKIVAGHNSLRHFAIVDGGLSLNVRVERESGLFEPRQQRVYVRFNGAAQAGVGIAASAPVPPLEASEYNQFFNVSPGWGDDETTLLKQVIMQTLESAYAGYDVEFISDDEPEPDLPFQTLIVGNNFSALGLLGEAAYIDPRNETLTGSGLVYGLSVGAFVIQNNALVSPVEDVNGLGSALGRVAAHEVGHLLGLRHTNDATDLMQSGPSDEDSTWDPTFQRTLQAGLVAEEEQFVPEGTFNPLPPIGIQDAPQLLLETVGPE